MEAEASATSEPATVDGQGRVGQGQGRQGQSGGGSEMLSAALDLGVIDPEEADLFSDVHERIDDYRLSLGDAATGNMEEMQDELLAGMVEAGQLSQTEADSFADIYARLDSAGVMQ